MVTTLYALEHRKKNKAVRWCPKLLENDSLFFMVELHVIDCT